MGVSNLLRWNESEHTNRVPASNASSTLVSEVVQENHSVIESGRFQNNTKHKNVGEVFDFKSDILFVFIYQCLLNHFVDERKLCCSCSLFCPSPKFHSV